MYIIDDVKVYDGDVYFDDWLVANGYYKREKQRDILLSNGEKTEEEFDEYIEGLEQEFLEWCDDHDLDGHTI